MPAGSSEARTDIERVTLGEDPTLGAYGLRITGLPGASAWMQPVEPDAAELGIHAELAAPDWRPSYLGPELADLRLVGGGRLLARKGSGIARFLLTSRAADADLLHPYLAVAAGLVQR